MSSELIEAMVLLARPRPAPAEARADSALGLRPRDPHQRDERRAAAPRRRRDPQLVEADRGRDPLTTRASARRNPDTGSFIYYNLAGAYDSNVALILTDGGSRARELRAHGRDPAPHGDPRRRRADEPAGALRADAVVPRLEA